MNQESPTYKKGIKRSIDDRVAIKDTKVFSGGPQSGQPWLKSASRLALDISRLSTSSIYLMMQAHEPAVSHGVSRLAASVPDSIVLVTFAAHKHGIERDKLRTEKVRLTSH